MTPVEQNNRLTASIVSDYEQVIRSLDSRTGRPDTALSFPTRSSGDCLFSLDDETTFDRDRASEKVAFHDSHAKRNR